MLLYLLNPVIVPQEWYSLYESELPGTFSWETFSIVFLFLMQNKIIHKNGDKQMPITKNSIVFQWQQEHTLKGLTSRQLLYDLFKFPWLLTVSTIILRSVVAIVFFSILKQET